MRTAWVAGKSIIGVFNKCEKPIMIRTHNPYTVFSGTMNTAEDIINCKDRIMGICYGTFSMCIDNQTFTVGVIDHTQLQPNTVTLIEYHSGLPIISYGFQGVLAEMLSQAEILKMCATVTFKTPTDLLFDICSKCERVNHL